MFDFWFSVFAAIHCAQVFLFGSRYDARSVWNSTRWDQHVPPVRGSALFYPIMR